jgi:fatty acid desaturase
VDTIILILLLITAIYAARGARAKIVVPLFVVSTVLVIFLFAHHTTSSLDLNF